MEDLPPIDSAKGKLNAYIVNHGTEWKLQKALQRKPFGIGHDRTIQAHDFPRPGLRQLGLLFIAGFISLADDLAESCCA